MEARFIEMDASRRLELVGLELLVRAGASDTAGALSAIEQRIPPGTGSPLHTVRQDKVLIVLDGLVTVQLGERRQRLGTGASAVIPRGVVHRFSNAESSPARILMLLLPGGHEVYLSELADLQARNGLTAASMSEAGARHGVVIHDTREPLASGA